MWRAIAPSTDWHRKIRDRTKGKRESIEGRFETKEYCCSVGSIYLSSVYQGIYTSRTDIVYINRGKLFKCPIRVDQ
jgi:hypothetical protein